MRSMQDTYIAAIEEAIHAAAFTASRQGDWANTGTIFAMVGLNPELVVHYNFQASYCQIEMTGNGIKEIIRTGYLRDRPPIYRVEEDRVIFYHLDYTDKTRVNRCMQLLDEALDTAREALASSDVLHDD